MSNIQLKWHNLYRNISVCTVIYIYMYVYYMISYSNVWGPNLPLSRKAATKVVGAIHADKDQSKEIVD